MVCGIGILCWEFYWLGNWVCGCFWLVFWLVVVFWWCWWWCWLCVVYCFWYCVLLFCCGCWFICNCYCGSGCGVWFGKYWNVRWNVGEWFFVYKVGYLGECVGRYFVDGWKVFSFCSWVWFFSCVNNIFCWWWYCGFRCWYCYFWWLVLCVCWFCWVDCFWFVYGLVLGSVWLLVWLLIWLCLWCCGMFVLDGKYCLVYCWWCRWLGCWWFCWWRNVVVVFLVVSVCGVLLELLGYVRIVGCWDCLLLVLLVWLGKLVLCVVWYLFVGGGFGDWIGRWLVYVVDSYLKNCWWCGLVIVLVVYCG